MYICIYIYIYIYIYNSVHGWLTHTSSLVGSSINPVVDAAVKNSAAQVN